LIGVDRVRERPFGRQQLSSGGRAIQRRREKNTAMSQPPIAEDVLSFQVIPSDSAKPRKCLQADVVIRSRSASLPDPPLP
jgi:hypothetical protein